IWLYRWLHPDIGVPLAKLMSRTSRNQNSRKPFPNSEDYLRFATDKIDQGFDFVVLGHTHQPYLKKIDRGWILNLGDWINHYSYGEFDGNELLLKFWDEIKVK
ncbi:MAG: UDP-2,3-diacylglucosamine hydrolase, partial [bacterium]|nr:UDP-2,3-diacylglucosamine hydrolase [bacterium]